jgi:hypothetical protein
MAKKWKSVWVFLLAAFILAGCQHNYYTSKAKNKDCGCPNKKGMVGY